MSDLVFKKGEWYHKRDGKLIKVDYEKEIQEYYKNWRPDSGSIRKNR